MAGFTEGGLKLQSSVASKMVELMPAAAAAGPYVVAILGAVAFVAQVVAWMSDDDQKQTEKALVELREAIEHLAYLIALLEQRLDEFLDEAARESNRQTLRDLSDYLDDVRGFRSQLQNAPGDAGTAVDIANRAGIVADKFLREDYEIWRWTDVVLKEVVNPATGRAQEEPDLAQLRFKNVPTLPVYLLAVLTWLAARERVLQLGAIAQLDGDGTRVKAHLDALAVRPVFRKHGPEEHHSDGTIKWTPTPATITENIKARIVSVILTGTRYPENGVCKFSFDLRNHMSGEQVAAGAFDLPASDANALCTVDPFSIGAPPLELEWEDKAGVIALAELREALARVALSGTARHPFVGQFPGWVASKSNYYGVNVPGQVVWFEHVWTSAAPGMPAALRGPHVVADGWNAYGKVLGAGGKGIYALATNGDLLWFEHAGAFTGEDGFSGPRVVGTGWGEFSAIVPGGNGVVYAIAPDGTLWWYKHEGFETGGDISTWHTPRQVGTGWTGFTKVFATANDGILYGVLPDGTLRWYKHTGVDRGANTWEGPHDVATGWHIFEHIFGADDGVIYAKPANEPLRWHRHRNWNQGVSVEFVTVGGRQRLLSLEPFAQWDGPVEVGTDRSRYLHMWDALPKPLPGGGVK